MPSWNPFHSKTPEETHNWLIRSTTRAIGKRLLNEPNLNARRRELIEEELSWRIGLMRKIRSCDPHAIFHYNSKGFKSFTSEYREILQRDLSDRNSYDRTPGSFFLDYNRSDLDRECEEAAMGDRTLRNLRGMREAEERVKEERERIRRDREKQEKEREVREREEARAREMRARDEREKKARKREDEYYVREMDKQARETREKKAREHQRSRGSRQGPPGAGRQDFEVEHRAQRRLRDKIYDDESDSHESDHRGRPPKEAPRGQNFRHPSMDQGSHNRQKSILPRQTKTSTDAPNGGQTKKASTHTESRVSKVGEEPQLQTKQASHPPKQPVNPAKSRSSTEPPQRQELPADSPKKA